MVSSQDCPWGVGHPLNTISILRKAPCEDSYIGLFGWKAMRRSTWHPEQSGYFHAKQNVLEEQRILCYTWPLTGIQNTKYFGSIGSLPLQSQGRDGLRTRGSAQQKTLAGSKDGGESSCSLADHVKCPFMEKSNNRGSLGPCYHWDQYETTLLFHWRGSP